MAETDLTFYEVVAVAIPVLLLALFLETAVWEDRVRRSERGPMREGISAAIAILLMYLGEIVALKVLVSGDAASLDDELAGLGLLAGLWLLATEALAFSLRPVAETLPEEKRDRVNTIYYVCVFLILVSGSYFLTAMD